jgi:hypothetical protein
MHVVGTPSVELGPTHDVLDGEIEGLGLLRLDRKSGEQENEAGERLAHRFEECVRGPSV